MPAFDFAALWPDTTIHGLITAGVLLLLLYLARRPAHAVVLGICGSLRNFLRISGKAAAITGQRLERRNREIILAQAEQLQEQLIEREFDRIRKLVKHDLSGFPALHRRLMEQISRIDDDYVQSAIVPPTPPAWLEAIAVVAQIPARDDPAVAKILEDIHATLESTSHDALLEYRAAGRRRHLSLRRMLPYWRRVESVLSGIKDSVSGLEQRTQTVNEQIHHYEEIRAASDSTLRALTSSVLSRFLASGLALALVSFAVFINHQLLSVPMDKMLYGSFGGELGADAAAIFVTLLQVGAGLVILESARVTHLLPALGRLDDAGRSRLLTAGAAILIALTVLEASLAYAGVVTDGEPARSWAAPLSMLLLGTILPFALAFTAIPLETFLITARTVAGLAMAALLRNIVLLLRIGGQLSLKLGQLIVRSYDLVIFAPLWLESLFARRPSDTGANLQKQQPADPAATHAPAAPAPTRGRRSKTVAADSDT